MLFAAPIKKFRDLPGACRFNGDSPGLGKVHKTACFRAIERDSQRRPALHCGKPRVVLFQQTQT